MQISFEAPSVEERVRLTAEMISGSNDVQELREWLEALEGTADDIRAQIEANRFAGQKDADWMMRSGQALSFMNGGANRVRRRLVELGAPVPGMPEHRIRMLETRVSEFKRREARWRLDKSFTDAAAELLDADLFGRVMKLAAEKMEPQTQQAA